MHRAGTCRAKQERLNKPTIELRARNPDKVGRGVRNVCAYTQPSDEPSSSRGQRASKRGDPCRVAPFLMGRRQLGCGFGLLLTISNDGLPCSLQTYVAGGGWGLIVADVACVAVAELSEVVSSPTSDGVGRQ